MTQLRRIQPIAGIVLLFGALLLTTQHQKNWMLDLLALTGLVLALIKRQPAVDLVQRRDLLPLAGGLIWSSYLLGLYAWYGTEDTDATYSRLLIAPLIVLALRLARPAPVSIWFAAALGAMGSSGIALWQVFVEAMPRATGFVYMIEFGDIALLMGLIALCGITHAMPRWQKIVLLLGVIAGLISSVLSGARGGWFALLLLIPLASLKGFSWRRLGVKTRWILGIVTVVLMISLTIPVVKRVMAAGDDLHAYGQGQVDTSLGMRFEMWHIALETIERHPWGIGPDRFNSVLLKKIEQLQASPALVEFQHPHNEWLQQAVNAGAVGVLALVALYGLFGVFFFRHLNHSCNETRRFAIAGLTTLASYFIFGLSETLSVHQVADTALAGWLALCWGMCKSRPPVVTQSVVPTI